MQTSQDLLSGMNLTTLVRVHEVGHRLDLGVVLVARGDGVRKIGIDIICIINTYGFVS